MEISIYSRPGRSGRKARAADFLAGLSARQRDCLASLLAGRAYAVAADYIEELGGQRNFSHVIYCPSAGVQSIPVPQ